jgi:hypothetical protein
MKIGIDISQLVYENTGVATYVRHVVATLVKKYPNHEYILFGSSFRRRNVFSAFKATLPQNIQFVILPIPPVLLDLLWNTLHIVPVEWFTGPIDIFWSSDWTQPPLARAKGVTTIHDLSTIHFPKESHNQAQFSLKNNRFSANIVRTQTSRLKWAKQECAMFFCDSESTKEDVRKIYNIPAQKLTVIYPGLY